MNRQLERGRPFFVDILKQGIALYEAEGIRPFVENSPPVSWLYRVLSVRGTATLMRPEKAPVSS